MTSDFLNPKSVLTPGIAGALIMMISNALAGAFDMAGGSVALLALALSFLVGLLLLGDNTTPWTTRLVLYIFNSLVIFSVGVGTNGIAGAVTAAPNPAMVSAPEPPPTMAPATGATPPPVTAPASSAPPSTVPPSTMSPGRGGVVRDHRFFRTWLPSAAERAIPERSPRPSRTP